MVVRNHFVDIAQNLICKNYRENKMKFSLVLCTLGRVKEVGLFLNSLNKQNVDYEIIIVDQNESDELSDYFNSSYKHLISKTKYIKTDKKGLSRSRNVGLKYITGEVVLESSNKCNTLTSKGFIRG